jgi:hypothetical protein
MVAGVKGLSLVIMIARMALPQGPKSGAVTAYYRIHFKPALA